MRVALASSPSPSPGPPGLEETSCGSHKWSGEPVIGRTSFGVTVHHTVCGIEGNVSLHI